MQKQIKGKKIITFPFFLESALEHKTFPIPYVLLCVEVSLHADRDIIQEAKKIAIRTYLKERLGVKSI